MQKFRPSAEFLLKAGMNDRDISVTDTDNFRSVPDGSFR